MFLLCTIAPAGAYQWNRPGRQRINQLQRICMAYDQVRVQAHAFLSHINIEVWIICRQFAFIWEKYQVSDIVLSERSTTMTSRRRFARHSVCSTGRANRYIYYLLIYYVQGGPRVHHGARHHARAADPGGEAGPRRDPGAAAEEDEAILLHLSTKLDSSDIDDVLSSVWSADNVYLLRNSSRRLTSTEMETLTTKNSWPCSLR